MSSLLVTPTIIASWSQLSGTPPWSDPLATPGKVIDHRSLGYAYTDGQAPAINTYFPAVEANTFAIRPLLSRQLSDGNFYGTTSGIPSTFLGTIYKITPQGAFTVLYSFTESVGSAPTSGLAQASDGNFYGSTTAGGENEQGILFTIAADGTFTTLLSLTYIVR